MGCQLSIDQAVYLTVSELGLEEADLQGWRVKDDHIECLGLVGKTYVFFCFIACHFPGQSTMGSIRPLTSVRMMRSELFKCVHRPSLGWGPELQLVFV
jgi:hypothetical protein